METKKDTYKDFLKKVDNPFRELLDTYNNGVGRNIKLSEDEDSAVDVFIRMLKIAGETAVNSFFKNNSVSGEWKDSRYVTKSVEEFNEFWFNLQKSLRQGDFYDFTTTKRVKSDFDFDKNNTMKPKKKSEYKNGDLQISVCMDGHLDIILRDVMQCTNGPYRLCKMVMAETVKIVEKEKA